MRESIGATWILGIVLTFIALFSGYLAFSINYSKAFRVKDGIVDRLEKHNGPNSKSLEDIEEFIADIGYSSKGSCETIFNDESLDVIGVTVGSLHPDNPPSSSKKYNYCIQKVTAKNPSGQLTAAYYKVVVFFSLSIPILNFGSSFHVDGETININYPVDAYMK